ncbi:hypothetical protein QAD02_018506 [Eretmocerus hayati]|uniref:Uncharacterized protein n=1 Tax=Eretmocerus hayati TaxID=131215 RepID=A0ACC2PJD6_9HYME|nr:hypothetical protein QAD02_018506 [Eretmocerus hayati]
MFSIRVVVADSYQANPIPDVDPTFSHFRGSEIKQVPVVRIFGITPEGEKVCLHVHGVFPYLYVPYTGQVRADILAYHLATAIDTAINVSMGSAKANTQHVYKIQQVSGIPIYGYHRKRHQFLRIYFYSPFTLKRATELLQSGCILDQVFQPHEAHIPFIMQFMIDYNIYGMSMINLKTIKHRHSSSASQANEILSSNSSDLLDSVINIPEEKEYLPFSVIKQSVCKIEVDAWASDIVNREVIDKGIDINPGIAAIWDDERARRAQAGMGGESQLTNPKSPERSQAEGFMTDSDIYQQTRLAQRLRVLESQSDESSLTPTAHDASYPIPAPDDSHLLNASQVEIHAGPLESRTFQRSLNQSGVNLINETLSSTLQSQFSVNNLSLDSGDYDVVELLANLASDQENTDSPIDANSILGSQRSSQNFGDVPPEQDQNGDEEDEDGDDNIDLNLTNLQLDTLNFTSWESMSGRSASQKSKNSESEIELALESLRYSPSDHSDDIPQLDGPIDDDNAGMSTSDEDNNVTVERRENVICEYKPQRKPKEMIVTTPRKRKTVSSSDDDENSSESTKRRRNSEAQRTPRRTPSKRRGSLTSPSCPSRTYSPLSVEIISSPRTPRTPKTPSTSKNNGGSITPKRSPLMSTSNRRRIRVNLGRRMACSPVKESALEEEEAQAPTEVAELPPKLTLSKPISEELFSSGESANSEPACGTVSLEGAESDRTLVEDTDDSSGGCTIDGSPPRPRVIIDESECESTRGRASSFGSSCIGGTGVPSVIDEDESDLNITFSQMIECRQKSLESQTLTVPAASGLDISNGMKDLTKERLVLRPKFNPPSRKHVVDTMTEYGIAKVDNVRPFFSEQQDADAQPANVANNALVKAKGRGLASLQAHKPPEGITSIEDWRRMKAREFLFSGGGLEPSKLKQHLAGNERVVVRPLKSPPDRGRVEAWLRGWKKQQLKDKRLADGVTSSAESSQKSSGSQNLSSIFQGLDPGSEASRLLGVSCGQIEFSARMSNANRGAENLGNAKALTVYQYLTVLCVEVHVITRPELLPDPRFDPIAAIFYAIQNDVPPDCTKVKPLECGVIIVDSNKANNNCKGSQESSAAGGERSVTYVENEEGLFEKFLQVIERNDPEILIGWDIEFLSWGYIFQRALILGKNLSGKISRIPSFKSSWEIAQHEDPTPDVQFSSRGQNIETIPEVRLPGRVVLDIWRVIKCELALTSFTFENCMFQVLNERVPYPSFDVLTKWWNSPLLQWRVIDHYTNKVIGVHRMIHHLDIINRSSELARLLGLQFYETFSRGSQYRVESMMLRLAKPLNYISVSPSHHQRGCMRAPEALPLIMEPESTMYSDPVVVLDFQSLYPSIIIAYNYCFSTCLGRIEHIGSPHPFEFGCTTLKVPKNLAVKLQDKVNFSPCGVAFIKEKVRKGILPKMLEQILETRFMVKKAIKDHPKDDRALQRVLHSRQLGLKLIANVTYGYTAANFSGRMPCIEVGDSVVSKGKETLERAIKLVESTSAWGARVIYGDTDSLFILLEGKSRAEAFKIGAEMADAVTAVNPKPVKLKFEKVMQPCILQTKKRYCGYMYENLNDEPVYLAKGIETVRRDGCPAVAKVLEKSLRILFNTKDLSLVKQYVTRQLDKILTGRVSIQDLTFAKEFRGMKGYKAAACVPALELTRRLVEKDPRAVPRKGARVPYIIVAGGPNEALIRCVRSPMELVLDSSLRPNATYYITKVIIPPLNRCLNLIGVDAMTWFMDMPHRQNFNRVQGVPLVNSHRKQKTLSQYLCNTTCPSCGQSCDKGICAACVKDQSKTLVTLHEKCRQYERIYSNIKKVCESCIGVMDADSCTSLDCPIFYRRVQAQRDNSQVPYLYDLIQCMEHLYS